MNNPHIPANLGQVVVRFLKVADHTSFIALERDEEVRRYVNGPSTKSDEQFLSSLNSYVPTLSLLTVADQSTDAFLGRCGLLPIRGANQFELFVLLAKSSQRRGIGRSVLEFLIQLARAGGKEPIGIVHPKNLASQALLEKAGMFLVGTLESENYQKGHLRHAAKDG
jgi:RimJ/RimL family protein N-acetyltransferase